ncbi:MAG: hypothetical protein AAF471_02595 [Myxococcota bacterium]
MNRHPCASVLATLGILAVTAAGCGKVDFRHAVAVGDVHACALDDRQQPVCWGNAGQGQRQGMPGGENDKRQFKRLAANGLITCGITTQDRLDCWGSDRYGDLRGFQQLRFITRVADIALGDRFICLLNRDSVLVCGGNTPSGAPVGRRLRRIACRGNACCGLWPNGLPICFGDLALAASPRAAMREIAVGQGYAVALDNGGHPWAWGDNQSVLQDAPQRSARFDAVAAGGNFACARRRDNGRLHCFGGKATDFVTEQEQPEGAQNAAGNGTRLPPNTLPDGRVLGFDIGRAHGCALLEDSRVMCFGDDEQDQFVNLPRDPLWVLPKWHSLLLERTAAVD